MNNIYVFKGHEELMIRNKIDAIVNNLNVPSFNKTTYDLEVASLIDCINDCLTIPFMSEKKIVIMRNPHFLEKGGDTIGLNLFLSYLKKPNQDCVLIIDATNIDVDINSATYKELEKNSEISDTKELTEVEMKGWLKRQFGINNVEMRNDAVNLFFDYVGTDLIRAKTEVDKLINYIGDKKEVTISDIEAVVSANGETDIFALTKAINTRNKKDVHNIYNDLIKNNINPINLLGLIYKSFKDMYLVLLYLEKGLKQNDIATAMQTSPGRIYYLMKDARNFDINRVEEILNNISDLDYKIKSGQIDKVTGLELFLFGL